MHLTEVHHKKEVGIMFIDRRYVLIILVGLVAVGLISCGAPKEESAPVAERTVTEGLIAYYPFNGNANDESNNGNTGTVHGAQLTKDRFGKDNSAYMFNGESDYMSLPIDINPGKLTQLTMVAWVNPNNDSPIRQVISHDDGGFDRSLGIDERGGGAGWSAFMGSGEVLGYHPVTTGKWVLVAVVYNQADSTAKLYVNEAVYEGKGICGTGHEYTYMGSNPSYGEFFSGAIDDVRIFDRVLTKEEIKVLYQEGGWKEK
jgi:hypothetical protein